MELSGPGGLTLSAFLQSGSRTAVPGGAFVAVIDVQTDVAAVTAPECRRLVQPRWHIWAVV